MCCLRSAQYLFTVALILASGCAHPRHAKEPVRVEIRTLDGEVGHVTGRGAVLECVMSNDIKNLKRLIAEGQDIKTPLPGHSRSWTFLHLAALQGHAGAAELLIQNGADVNAKSKDGVTPLGVAQASLWRGSNWSNVVELLRQHGAE